jgi:hypothetical protein
MVSRTWLGGGNNRASNPEDWSPAGVPQSGDTLTMMSGTINIRGNDLASPGIGGLSLGGLDANGSTTINLTNAKLGNPVTEFDAGTKVNVHGSDTAYLSLNGAHHGAGATVDLIANAHWSGGFKEVEANITVNGAGTNATFANVPGQITGNFANPQKQSVVEGGNAIINANVVGHGGFELDRFKGVGGQMEFMHSVGAKQTVTVNTGMLRIDHPSQFLGSVMIPSFGSGDIDLVGLVTADSYSYHNDMLSIFGAGQVLDTLRLASAVAFNVEKTSVGVSIYTDPNAPNFLGINHPAGTLLPMHA